MKIRKLNIENIHSLKGKQTIDFADGVLGAAGLFAITGPTGSGKSTILDAITLALYNRIPRLDRPITEKVIEEEGVIITKNALDCFAEVEYEVKGKIYRSSWSIRRTRTNSLASRKQELIDGETGAILVSGKNVVEENERIIGLTYEQFVQSLILAQGQFAKLLLAKKDDRNKLLEEITGASIYRKIGSAVYGRYKKANDAVDDQKLIMGEIVLLNEDDLKLITDDIAVKKPGIQKSIEEIKILDGKKIVKEGIKVNLQKKIENEEAFLKFNEEKKEASLKQLILDEHNRFVIFKDQMLQIEREEELLKELTDKINSLTEVELPKFEAEKVKFITAGTELIDLPIDESNYEALLEEFRIRVVSLLELEKESQSEAKQEALRIQDKIKDLKAYKIELIERSDISFQIEEQLKFIDDLSKKNGVFEIEKLRVKKDDIVKSLLPANQLLGDRKLYDEKNKGITELKAKIKKASEQIEEYKKESKFISLEFQLLIEPLQKAKLELEEWQKRKSLDQHRHELQKDKPCPLCGGLEHPYALNTEEVLISTLQGKYDELFNKSEGYKIAELKVRTKAEELAATNLLDAKDLETRRAENALLETKVNNACKVLNWKIESPLADWEAALFTLQGEQSELDSLEKKLLAKVILMELLVLYQNYEILKSKFEEIKKIRSAAYNGTDVNLEVSNLKQKISQSCLSVKNLNENLITGIKERNVISDKISKIKEDLLKELIALGVDTFAILKTKILEEVFANQIRKDLQALVEKEVRLNTNKEIILKELKAAQELDDASISLDQVAINLGELTKNLELLKQHIWEQENKINDNDKNKEKQKKYGDVLIALQKELNIWTKMNLLIGDATGKKFSNFVQDLTLRKLIEYGNSRLAGFSDRYLLDVENDSDVLKVIDTYMGNSKRAVTSLSGGETFMLSLALAFGLSDLAARNVEIESLFIDEGFGSLDPESLDQAITILENMQNESNKSIGIISHVGELKDRIGTKIKLVRTGAGYSTIEIE